MRKLLLSILLALSATMAVAQESQTGYNFLRLPASAHAAALGGDNITLIEDDEALIFHNPALLSSVSDKTINLGYMNYMSGVNAASAAFNRIVKDKASWAVSAQYVDYGKMKQVDENNVQMGEFSTKDIAVAIHCSGLRVFEPSVRIAKLEQTVCSLGLLRKLSLPNLIRERKGKGIRLHLRNIRLHLRSIRIPYCRDAVHLQEMNPGGERLAEHTITLETTVGIGLLDEENIPVEGMRSHDGSNARSQLLG